MRSAKIGFRHTRGEHFPERTILQLRENLDALLTAPREGARTVLNFGLKPWSNYPGKDAHI